LGAVNGVKRDEAKGGRGLVRMFWELEGMDEVDGREGKEKRRTERREWNGSGDFK
jgi:hypothetical protein